MAKGESGVSVSLKLIDEQEFEHTGKMDFVDNAIDRSSGTIRGRAVLDNPGARFTPGMFGHIRVPGSPPHTALLIPDAAIGTEQSRKFVLVVDDGSVARQKYVKLGQLDGGLRVIKDGLAAGDKVIVKGLMRARSGQKVTVEDEPAPPPPRKGPDEAKAG
jgi:RND family efflux transporter MFP subunit